MKKILLTTVLLVTALYSDTSGLNALRQDIPLSGHVNHMYYNNEWREVLDCSGTGLGFCRLEFTSIHNKKLVVITQGECLTSDFGLPKKGEKCDVSLARWYFE